MPSPPLVASKLNLHPEFNYRLGCSGLSALANISGRIPLKPMSHSDLLRAPGLHPAIAATQ